MIQIQLSKSGRNIGKYSAWVDDLDADLDCKRWFVERQKSGKVYAARLEGKKKVLLHRIIAARILKRPPTRREFVHFRNSWALDCRRTNIQIVGYAEKARKRRRYSNNPAHYSSWSITATSDPATVEPTCKTVAEIVLNALNAYK